MIILIGIMFISITTNTIAEDPPEDPPEGPPIVPEDYSRSIVEGIGTYFEVINSSYLNVSLTSSKNIYVFLETMPGGVNYIIKGQNSFDPSQITISGLLSNFEYFLYEDGYLIMSFFTDDYGSFSYIQDLTGSHHISVQEFMSTIYIESDGSIYPSSAPILRVGNTYTLTGDIFEPLYVYKSGIILDGDGYSILGSGSGYGLYLNSLVDVTIKNLNVQGFYYNVRIYYCNNINLSNNTISNNSALGIDSRYGVYNYKSDNTKIIDNTISNCLSYGISISSSDECIVTGNTISNCYYGISQGGTNDIYIADNEVTENTFGISQQRCTNILITENMVYNNSWMGISVMLSSARVYNNILMNNVATGGYWGFGISVSSANNCIVEDNHLSQEAYAIRLYNASYNIILNNTINNSRYSIELSQRCHYNILINNKISNSITDGISLFRSGIGNIIYKNTLLNNFWGISPHETNNVTITENNLSYNRVAVSLSSSYNSTIAGNLVSHSWYRGFGIYCLSGISDCTLFNNEIIENTISNNEVGLQISSYGGSKFYHNDIIDNTIQVLRYNNPINEWNNSYGEGNKWSDYPGLDDGSNGRISGDGIGDTDIPHPYIDQGSGYYQLDNYPLMDSWIDDVNDPPVANIIGTYNTFEGENITFDASSSSDPDEWDILLYRWDFDNDGTWDTSYSIDSCITYIFEDDYTGTIAVQVYDGECSSTAYTTVVVNNIAPTANAGEDKIGDEPSTFIFTGDHTDPGIDDTHTYEWDFDYDGVTFNIDATGNNIPHTWSDDYTGTVALKVTDDDGGSNVDTLTVTINNVDPNVMIPGGTGITDNYIVVSTYSTESYFIDILSDGSLASPQFIDDKMYRTYGAGIGDFDNDGDLDVLVGDLYNTWYYEKTGEGNSFESAVSIDTTYHVYRMDFAEADYNNDGNLDAIMSGYYDFFTLYTGYGDGTFTISTLSAPSYVIGMDSADFNNDGNMDFIAASNWYDAYIYMGNGDGTFQSPIILDIGWSMGVSAGDFNNDGNDDFIFGSYTPLFYPGNGDGSFGLPAGLGTYIYTWGAFAESDINGDGNLDLVYTNNYDNVVYLTGNGDGTFNFESSTYVDSSLYGIAVWPESGTGGLEADEGELIEFNGTFSDLGWLDTHTASWNWGDGTPADPGVITEENIEPLATGNVSGNYTYGDNGEYTVTLTVTDDDEGSGSDTITVNINNVAPTVDAGSDFNAFVGIPADFNGSFYDPGWLDTHTIEWNWGDSLPVGSGTLTPQHTFTESGVFTVTLTVTDDDGGTDNDILTVTVYYPPVADAGINQTVDEGDTVNFDASLSTGAYFEEYSYDWIDAMTLGVRDDTLSTNNDTYVLWDIGFTFNFYGNDYTQVYICTNGYLTFETGYWYWNNRGETLPTTNVYIPPNLIAPAFYDLCPYYGGDIYIYQDLTSSPKKFVVEWHECEMYQISGMNTFEVILYETGVIKYQYAYSTNSWSPDWYGNYPLVGIQNKDRTIGIEYKDYIDQSLYDELAIEFYSDSNSYNDLVMNTIYYSINSYEWDFDNDGTYDYQETPTSAPDGIFDGKTTHIYGDNNWYTVTVQVTDELGATATDTCLITVNNVAPTITTLTATIDPVQLGDPITANAEFTDPGFLDTHTANIDWGDDTVDNLGTVTSPITNLSHTYNSTGVYTITLTVIDDDGDNDTMFFKYVVIYDPSAGFVTGGGWIMSPEGSYTPNPNLTGKANFGFVAKYKKGQSTPDGNTEFQFKAANMNFHSSDYQWLVIQIAGAKAMFKGNGTINGEGNYGFKLTAIDEDITPSTDIDMFRIKIWDKDNDDQVIYDNQLGDEDDSDPSTPISGGNIKIHKG
jgi:parallel beta-helix repeat protein